LKIFFTLSPYGRHAAAAQQLPVRRQRSAALYARLFHVSELLLFVSSFFLRLRRQPLFAADFSFSAASRVFRRRRDFSAKAARR